MQAPLFVLLVFLIAFFFFGLIPGIGAFTVRAHWRSFRRRIIEASLFPFVEYSNLAESDRFLGNFRFFGNLEAIQGKNRIWINSDRFTVEIDLEGVPIYTLPSGSFQDLAVPIEKLEGTLPDEEPKSLRWDRIFSLPAGIKIFVGGPFFSEDGRGVFRVRPKEPLVVVIYDGDKESILLRAIWGGRQRDEYWNRYTLVSLITGSFAMLLTAYIMLRTPLLRLPSLFALSLSFFPIIALLPPGVAFYFLYRYFWKKARLLRAERDLIRLPIRYFKDEEAEAGERFIRLPTREVYIMTNDPAILIKGELKIRGSNLLNLPDSRTGDYYIFGAYHRNEEERFITEPADPMAECILILGDPVTLAKTCRRRARIFELLSVFFIFSGIIINLFLILIMWHNLIH